MSGTFVSELAGVDSPFLAGFGRYCAEHGLSDDAARQRLQKAAQVFPAVRDEIESFHKKAFLGPALKMMGGAMKAAPGMLSKVPGVSRMMGMAPKVAPAAPGLAGAAPGLAGAPGLGSRLMGGIKAAPGQMMQQGSNLMNQARNLPVKGGMGSTALGGGLGLASGYQNGGISGALTEGAMGALGGRYGGAGGALTTPLQTHMFGVGGMAQGAMQMGQRQLGMGAPSFQSQIDPNAATPNDLHGQLYQGMQELDQQGKRWQDNSWSGGRYGQAVSQQRSKLYDAYRARGQQLGMPSNDIEGALQGYTPAVTSQDPHQMWSQVQDPETRKLFGQQLMSQQQQLLEQAKNGQVDGGQVKNVLMGHAAMSAAEQGMKPDELISKAQATLENIQQNGITPETAQQIFQGDAGKKLAQSLIDQGNVRSWPELLKAGGDWITQNPMQGGMMLLGIPMALWGLTQSMSGNGGMGSLLAMLGGGAMAAHGAGMFGGEGGLMQALGAPKPNATPKSIPVAQAPAASSWAAHYSQNAGTPEGAQQTLQGLQQYAKSTPTPYDDKIVKRLTPEMIPQVAQQYMQSPATARANAFNQIPGYQRPFVSGAFDEGWNSLTQHLNSPHAG